MQETALFPGELDRRERKKRQTRDALVHAALELFDSKGYEQTTVREITDAVDVATRTFFRHFASKEDLVVSFSRDFSAQFLAELGARPPAETPLVALRTAFVDAMDSFTEDEAASGRHSAYLTIIKLVENTPSLLAAYLRSAHEHADEIVQVLAKREGVDPATDLRPQIAATVFMSLVATATKRWKDDGCPAGAREILRVLDEALAQLGPALAGHWS